MASRTLEITLISAKDLKDVNHFSKMEVYAVVLIDGDSRTEHRTAADSKGGTNPTWRTTFRVPVPEDDPSRHVVHVILRTKRALGDRDVGEVHIPLKEFFSGSGYTKTPQFKSYQVVGKSKGVLNLSFNRDDGYPPAYGYQTPPYEYPQQGYSQYAPPQGYLYPPPPPPAGYSNSAPPQGYGYAAVPPQQPQKTKKNKLSLGLVAGVGMVGEALLQTIVTEAISDAGSYVENYSAS